MTRPRERHPAPVLAASSLPAAGTRPDGDQALPSKRPQLLSGPLHLPVAGAKSTSRPKVVPRSIRGASSSSAAIVEHGKERHPYQVPWISARPIYNGNPEHLNWIAAETQPPDG
ncbi:divalent cation tolerance protein CutA [Pseudonocardia zijingensis]|uniref:divalent cation tolerance protein CutA n=1 Tax=Pseudonocardia zijingensis TaxID=153376 RepID=UPI0036158003